MSTRAKPQPHHQPKPPDRRALWRHRTGRHVQSQVEEKLRWLKAFGYSIAAEEAERRIAEIQIGLALRNRVSAQVSAQVAGEFILMA